MQDTTILYESFMPPAGTTVTTTRPMTKRERKDIALSKLTLFTLDILQGHADNDSIKTIHFKHNGYRVSLDILHDAIVVNTMHVSESYKVRSQTYPYVAEFEGRMSAYKWLRDLKDPCVHLRIIKLIQRAINNKKAVAGMKKAKPISGKCCPSCGTKLSDLF